MKAVITPSSTRIINRRALILASSIASLFATEKAVAASGTWLGLTDALWALDANWSAPFPVLGDTATFDNAGNGNGIIDLGAGVTVGNIAFDSAAVAAYTLGSGAVGSQSLTLGNGGTISLASTVAANQLIHAALTLGNDGTAQTFTLSNASLTNSLTVAGGISGSTGAGLKTLSIGGAGATVLSGIISNGTGGTVGITKTGNGALSLSNAVNTFSGGVTLGANTGTTTATTFNGTNATGLGTGAVSIGAGSTLNLQSTNTVVTTTTINNTFTGTGLLKLTFTGVTATNTAMNGLAGFAGTIQLSNTGVNGDKLNTNSSMANLAASLIIDSGSSLFVPAGGTANFAGGISLNGAGNSENRGAIRMGTAVLGGNISLAGSSTIGLDANAYGILTGNISSEGASTLTFGGSQAGNGTLTGNLSDGPGTLSLTKANAGTLWLTRANNYTGATTISGGRLQLGLGGTTGSLSPSSAISVASGASLTLNRSNAMAQGVDFGTISGAGNVTQNGTGTTTFAPAVPMIYTGQTQVNRGTLALDFANMATPTNLVDPTSVLNLGGGTLSLLGNSTGTTSQTFSNGTTLSAGRSTISPNRNGGTSVTVTLGALANNAGSSLFFTPATAWAAGGSSTTAGTASTTEIVTVSGVTRNGTAVTMPAAGTYGYIGANVFFGTGISARYVVAQGAAAEPYQLVGGPTATPFVTTGGSTSTVYSIAANQTLTGATTNYALIGNSTTAMTLANAGFAHTLNGYLGVNTASVTMSGTGSVVIGAEKDFVVNLTSSGSLAISAVIANSAGGASSVTNSSTGTGVLTLSGANTYTGGTFFNGGITSIATDGAASAASQLGTVPGAATPGNLTFNGGTLRFVPTAAVTLNAFRGITLGASGGTITNTAAFAVTVNSIIAGVGALTLSNTSTVNIAVGGVNTYTGGTIIGGTGQIVPTNNSAFGVGGVITLNGGQMRASTTANITLGNPVLIAANTTFPSVATEKSLIFTGPATLDGTRTLTSGVGATVANTSVQFSNSIGESVALSGLTKAGTGEIVLGGLNTFTGPTSITAGRLTYTKTFALYSNTQASWTDTNITVGNSVTLNLRVGGTNEFTAANVAAIAALGTATGGFQNGSYIGLDTGSGNFTYGNVLANTNGGSNIRGLMKLGANSLTLTAANTYTGTTYIGGGTLIAANPAAFGPAGNDVAFVASTTGLSSGVNLTNGNIEFVSDTSMNAYDLIGSSTFASSITLSRATSGAAVNHTLGLLNWGNNVLTVQAGANNSSGTPGVEFNGMNLTAGGAGTGTLAPTSATISITGPVNIGFNIAVKNLGLGGTSVGNTISGAISNGIGTVGVTKSDTSSWTISGANTYTGATTVSLGTLILSGANTGSGATSIVGGTLQAGADGALNPNSAVTMTNAAAAVLDLNGKLGTIASLAGGGALGGNVTLGSGTLTTGDVASTSYSGNITGAGNLVKAGTGAFTLATPQSYTGTTAVNGGTLFVNSSLASSAVTVAGSTLAGVGTFAGTVTINSGGMLSPATSTTAGTITLAGLTLNAGSGIAYEFGGTSDLVSVTNPNGLTLNGGAVSLYATGGVTPLVANGIYTLFSYITGFGGALSNLSVANAQAGKTYSVADAGGTITLTIGTATSSDWNGAAANGLWTDAGNWTGGIPNSVGATAAFGTVPTSPTAVAVNGPKTLGALIFDNANAYTVTGGAAEVITLENGIAAGAISVTTGNHTISAPIALNGPINITHAIGTSITLGGIITGAKTITYNGAGTATVSGVNTYSAGTTLISGTLSLANGAALGTGTFTIAGGTLDAASALTLTYNNAQVWSGDFTFAGSNNLNLGTGAVSIPASKIVTVNGGTLTVSGSISGSGFTKAGAGTLELTGNNTYTGVTTVGSGSATAGGGGTLVLSGSNTAATGSINVGNGGTLELRSANAAGTLGNPSSRIGLFDGSNLLLRADSSLTFNGTNSIGGLNNATVGIDVNELTAAGTNETLTISPGVTPVGNTVTLNITGGNGYALVFGTLQNVTGTATNVTLNPTTANVSLGGYNALNNGANNSTLTLSGTTTGNSVTGVIANQAAGSTGTGGTALTKLGTSTWTLFGTNTYTRATTIDQGTLVFAANQTLAGGLVFGATVGGTNTASLDLSAANATFGSLVVQTNSATANNIAVGASKSLTITNGLTIGYDAGSGFTGALPTKLTVGGGGTLSVNGTTITIGVNQAGVANQAFWNDATLDVTGLFAFNTNVTTFNIGVGGQTQGPGTVLLSNTANTLLATTLTLGDTGGNNGRGPGTLTLGTGINVIQVNTIQIGRGKSSGNGFLRFASQTAGSPGTVTITDKAGTGAANITVGDNGTTTGTAGGAVGTLDLRGHVATVTAGTLTIGKNSMTTNTGGVAGTVFFDTGTFSVTTLNMAPKTGAGTGNANATLNIGGGSFTVNSGGTFTLGSQATAAASNATLNLTGGTFTSNADIVDGGGANTSTITLNGGTLDMTGKNIGGATVIDILNLQSGILKNVAEINGGGAISKTTLGTLTIEGINTYTGATMVNAGTLIANGSISGSAVTVDNTGTLGGSGGTLGTLTANLGGTVSPGASIGTLNSSSASFAAGSTFALEINTTAYTTDLLAVTGNISLAVTNDTILSVTDLGAGIYNGTPLPFITYTGTWDGNLFSVLGTPIADGGTITVGANTFELDYNYGGNSVALVPEPGSAALLLGGLGMLGFSRRRRA